MKKIFVGNLAWKATEESLKELFEAHGEVESVKIVMDQYTGKSKGFGFVEMKTPEGAQNAIRELNDKPYLERNLRVSLAQERTERPERREGGRSFNGDRGGDRGYRPARGNSDRYSR
jgi:RNA recognition motif-containing protein